MAGKRDDGTASAADFCDTVFRSFSPWTTSSSYADLPAMVNAVELLKKENAELRYSLRKANDLIRKLKNKRQS
jgi:hypothetical protein